MKKSIAFILLMGVIALMSCQNVKVKYPIPLKSSALFLINTSGGVYYQSDSINTADIFADIQKELKKAGLTLDDLDGIRLEGAAYTMLSASELSSQVQGIVAVQYNSPPPPDTIMTVKPLVFRDILNKPQVDVLNPAGVAILNQALMDLVDFPGANQVIVVNTGGSLITGGDITFQMLVEFTITAVVVREMRRISPLG